MKLLITGAGGQLGSAFNRELGKQKTIHYKAYSRSEMDITDSDKVEYLVAREQPDFIINTAAYTQVDLAESEQQKAYAINQTGPANLAQVCQQRGIGLVHFSTDYIFDGQQQGAWSEKDVPAPLGVYGASKLAGEEAVRQACDHYLIFRTSWMFSEFGHNFVKTMLRLGSTQEQLSVVADQFGKPTNALEIATVVLKILAQVDNKWGIYHLAQPEPISWHGFAQAIFSAARPMVKQAIMGQAGTERAIKDQELERLMVKEVLAIPGSAYPTPAQRPANSVLDCSKVEQTFGIRLSSWRQSLADTLIALNYSIT